MPEPDEAETRQEQVSAALDEFHAAAALADEERYLGRLTPDAVFLGTDPADRWQGAEFRTFAHSLFSEGKGWTYRPSSRSIVVAEDGRTALFRPEAPERLVRGVPRHRRAPAPRRRLEDRAVQPHHPGPGLAGSRSREDDRRRELARLPVIATCRCTSGDPAAMARLDALAPTTPVLWSSRDSRPPPGGERHGDERRRNADRLVPIRRR